MEFRKRRNLKINVFSRFVKKKNKFLKQDSLRENKFIPSVTRNALLHDPFAYRENNIGLYSNAFVV